MQSVISSLFYKKYSLKLVQFQVLFSLGVTIFLCGLTVLTFEVNGSAVSLQLGQILSILAFQFIISGIINAQIELHSKESIEVYLLQGKKLASSFYILLVEVLDALLQAIFFGGLVLAFFALRNGLTDKNVEVLSSYLLGSIIYFLVSYYLTLLLKSGISSLAILLIFPLLVGPYLERVFPTISHVMFYQSISDSIQGKGSTLQELSSLFWVLLSGLLLVRKTVIGLKS